MTAHLLLCTHHTTRAQAQAVYQNMAKPGLAHIRYTHVHNLIYCPYSQAPPARASASSRTPPPGSQLDTCSFLWVAAIFQAQAAQHSTVRPTRVTRPDLIVLASWRSMLLLLSAIRHTYHVMDGPRPMPQELPMPCHPPTAVRFRCSC